jgi:uncharacterized membrane protein
MVDTIILISLAVTSILTIFFGFYAVKFGIILLRVQDQTEESLDIIDTQYQAIVKVLEIPLANDSPQVKEFVKCMSNVRDAILVIGNVLVESSSNEEIDKIAKN